MIRIEVVNLNLIVVHGLTVNYDQTPSEATEGLPDNDPDVAKYPQALWSGGKSGIVEGLSIPIHFPRRYFTTSEGRKAQQSIGIGYGCPADLAALKDESVCKALQKEKMMWLVALCENNQQLWHGVGFWRPVVLRESNQQVWEGVEFWRPVVLGLADYHGFILEGADASWDMFSGIVGAPKQTMNSLDP